MSNDLPVRPDRERDGRHGAISPASRPWQRASDLALITKIDLTEAVEFDRTEALKNLQEVRPGIEALETSSRTGEGRAAWLERLQELRELKPTALSGPR